MNENLNFDIFISYSHKDYLENNTVIPGNLVSQIKSALDKAGISYWFDENGVLSGDEFAPLIARAIKSCKIFIFISSSNSNTSEWTIKEIATANTYRKKIIPVRLDDSLYSEQVIMYLAALNHIDIFTNPEKELQHLVEDIKNFLAQLDHKKINEKKKIITQKHKVPGLVGLDHFDTIQKSILKCQTIKVGYKSYKAQDIDEIILFPYILKEFRSRWFVIGSRNNSQLTIKTLALDRIHSISIASDIPYQNNSDIDVEHFFDDVVGVSKNINDVAREIKFWTSESRYKYLITKPFHPSQKIVEKIPGNGCVFTINVVMNRELFSELLTFGNDLRVIYPFKAVNTMKSIIGKTLELYKKKSYHVLHPEAAPIDEADVIADSTQQAADTQSQ